MTRVEIVVFDGFDEIDAFGPFEVLSAAGLETRLVRRDSPGRVTSMRGVNLDIDEVLGTGPDGIVVPGGGWLNKSAHGAYAESVSGALTSQLAEIAPDVRWLAAVCSGVMLLATAGLLIGRDATTNPGCYQALAPYCRTVINERVVDHGDRVTAGALFCGVDLGLWMVERELGSARANAVAQGCAIVRGGPVWHAAV